MMNKSVPRIIPDRLYFRIGDVAEIVGVKPYVLRYWETEFPMISPQKSASGQRVYRRSDVETVLLIRHLLYVERYSIDGARRRIRELRREGELKAYLARKVGADEALVGEGLEIDGRDEATPAERAGRASGAHPRIEQAAAAAAALSNPVVAPPSAFYEEKPKAPVIETAVSRSVESLAARAEMASLHPVATSTPMPMIIETPVPTAASTVEPALKIEEPVFRFSDLGEAMTEAQELARLAAERVLGPLESDSFAFGTEAAASGATAAGAPVPIERSESALEAFNEEKPAKERLGEIIRTATDLEKLAETPISQLYA